jgi:hypothetical protein
MTDTPNSNFFKEVMYWSGGIYVLYLVGSFIVGLFPDDDAPRRTNTRHYQQEQYEYIPPHKNDNNVSSDKNIKLYQNPYGSEEPLPSEVREEDQDMYNWITDHPDYNGDWEYWVDEYENSQQQGDEYDDEF